MNKRALIVLDNIKFKCNEEDEDDEDDKDEESWICVGEGCKAEILVNNEEIFVEKSTSHTCKPCLKMTVMNRGQLDGYYFERQDNEQWKCENCECKIQTKQNENSLKYPHSAKMHKCISESFK